MKSRFFGGVTRQIGVIGLGERCLLRDLLIVAWIPLAAVRHGLAQETQATETLPGNPAFRALVVVASSCTGMSELPNAEASAEKFSNALHGVGYEVLPLVFDAKSSDPRLQRAEIDTWLDRLDRDGESVRLAIVALVGHGVNRDGRGVFLTAEASKDEGGLDMQALNERATKAGWPLVIIADCCRNAVGSQGPATPNGSTEALVSDTTRGLGGQEPSQHPVPTIDESSGDIRKIGRFELPRVSVYSTRPGERASDSDDLVSRLAEGLKRNESTGRFLADPGFRTADRETIHQLRLYDWLRFGVTRMSFAHGYQRQAQLHAGWPDMQTTMVAQDGDVMVPAKNPIGESQATSLLEFWKRQEGDGDYKSRRPFVGQPLLQFDASPHKSPRPWCGGYVANRPFGFKLTSPSAEPGSPRVARALFLQVELRAKTPGSVAFDAKYVDNNRNWWLLTPRGHKLFFALPPGRTVWCVVPLLGEPGQLLNYFAISDLPEGGSLLIRQMILADEKMKLEATSARLDLAARWWVGVSDRPGLTSVHEVVERDDRTVLRLLARSENRARCGGVLRPPMRVTGTTNNVPALLPDLGNEASSASLAPDTVQVIVNNPAPEPIHVEIELEGGGRNLAFGEADIKAEVMRATIEFPVSDSGTADFMSITPNKDGLEVVEVWLEPAPPAQKVEPTVHRGD